MRAGSGAAKIRGVNRVPVPRANGALSAKVFKWKNLRLGPGESVSLSKNHTLKEVTVRAYYSGEHRVAIQVNGVILGEKAFELTLK